MIAPNSPLSKYLQSGVISCRDDAAFICTFIYRVHCFRSSPAYFGRSGSGIPKAFMALSNVQPVLAIRLWIDSMIPSARPFSMPLFRTPWLKLHIRCTSLSSVSVMGMSNSSPRICRFFSSSVSGERSTSSIFNTPL